MRRYSVTIVLLLIGFYASAQAGLYLKADDYVNGSLTHEQGDFEKHKIRADIPFNKYVVKVVDGGESHKYFKWDLYGFRNKKNESFRFYNEKAYRIVDTTSFPVYAREENIVRGKEKTRETRYYLIKGAESHIVHLTINNLKRAFPNREFHDLLDLQFRHNRELMRYDAFHQEYKIKSIFNKVMS